MTDNAKDIDALLRYLSIENFRPAFHAAVTALVAERNALQAKINAHAEDRRKYIDAWEAWIASTKRLGIAEWLRVYADAVPIPSLDGDEANERVFKHLDQRMRDAADTIDELRKRIEELESHPPASDFRERDGYLEGNKQTLRALEEANEIARRYKRERDEALDRVFAMDAMRKRVAELEARAKPVYITDGQRVESIDLRERLVCAIWPEIMRQWREYKDAIDPRGCARSDALEEADKMIAAMRKGVARE